MKNLKQLNKAIDRLQSLYDINHEFMDADDLGDLIVTIQSLKDMYNKMYKKQVKQFVDYLTDTIDANNEPLIREWLEEPYVIKHGSHSVTVHNDADFYDGLLTLLKEHYREY